MSTAPAPAEGIGQSLIGELAKADEALTALDKGFEVTFKGSGEQILAQDHSPLHDVMQRTTISAWGLRWAVFADGTAVQPAEIAGIRPLTSEEIAAAEEEEEESGEEPIPAVLELQKALEAVAAAQRAQARAQVPQPETARPA